MRVALYLRISSDREGRELGVTRQREDCEALAARLGYIVVDVYQDNDRGASTRSKKTRPEFARMLTDAKAGKFQAIIAYTSGRLTRRPLENEGLIELAEQQGVQFRYVASPSFDLNTASGRRIARMLAANDAAEAEEISERVARETLQRAQQGRAHGGPRSYGYTQDELSKVPDEAARVADWYAHILAGGSIRSIRIKLAKAGVLNPSGKPWHDSAIRCILLNERYMGKRFLNGEEFPSPSPAIVTEETWRAAHAIITNPARQTQHSKARKWLGAGLYLCDRCSVDGAVRTVSTSYDGVKGNNWRIYFCKGCHRSWKADRIDEWVIEELITDRFAQPDMTDLLAREQPDTGSARTEAAAVRSRLTQLAEEFADGVLTAQQLRVATTRLRERLDELEAQMTAAGASDAVGALASADDPVAAWLAIPAEDVTRRQAIVRGICEIRLGTPIRGRAKWEWDKFITVIPR